MRILLRVRAGSRRYLKAALGPVTATRPHAIAFGMAGSIAHVSRKHSVRRVLYHQRKYHQYDFPAAPHQRYPLQRINGLKGLVYARRTLLNQPV